MIGGAEGVATDRESAIRYRVGAQVARAGSVVLPARTISDLVVLLDAQRVDVMFDEGTGAGLEQSKSALTSSSCRPGNLPCRRLGQDRRRAHRTESGD